MSDFYTSFTYSISEGLKWFMSFLHFDPSVYAIFFSVFVFILVYRFVLKPLFHGSGSDSAKKNSKSSNDNSVKGE